MWWPEMVGAAIIVENNQKEGNETKTYFASEADTINANKRGRLTTQQCGPSSFGNVRVFTT